MNYSSYVEVRATLVVARAVVEAVAVAPATEVQTVNLIGLLLLCG
jgi:hypothetical protein